MPGLADNPRTAVKAQIKRATARAQALMNRLDRERLARIDALYRRAADDLRIAIGAYAGRDGTLRLEVLRRLLNDVNNRLDQLASARDDLFPQSLLDAARLGAQPFEGAGVGINLVRVPDEAVRFVQAFVGEDGLQLTDRLWRVDRGARDSVTRAIESAIIQGHSASRAAEDFLTRGAQVPADLQQKIVSANAARVGSEAAAALVSNDDSARANVLRVFRTEMNRAHGTAYREAGFQHPDVIGTRFLLSPRHPEVDICDMHARVNRYGLGPGVYPKGKSPWPAHPNTLSYEEVVFSDEVTDEDRAGKEDRLDWLNQQDPLTQASVLGSTKKRGALMKGLLKENEIATPWRVLRDRYERKGIDISTIPVTAPETDKTPIAPGERIEAPRSGAIKVSAALDVRAQKKASAYVIDIIDSVHDDGRLPKIPIENASSNANYFGAYTHTLSGKAVRIRIRAGGDHKEHTLAHEIGHFLDHQGLPGDGFSSEGSPALQGWRDAIEKTRAITRLRDIERSKSSGYDGYLEYLLRRREMWARSYAQWLTLRSGDPVLRSQLTDIVSSENGSKFPIPSQWTDDDFADVAQEIDKLMKKVGWM